MSTQQSERERIDAPRLMAADTATEWAIYMRDSHGPWVLLTDGAWTSPSNANKPFSDDIPMVLLRAKTFKTRHLARLHMLAHCDSRAYVAKWKGAQ